MHTGVSVDASNAMRMTAVSAVVMFVSLRVISYQRANKGWVNQQIAQRVCFRHVVCSGSF
jgi:hypothetical protein